jgi:hypothetical protein
MPGRPVREAVVVSVVLLAAGGACVPSDPGVSSEVAVRRSPGGEIEVASCSDDEFTDLRLVAVENPGEETRDDELLWRVTFDPAVSLESVVLGEVPDGGEEREPWPTQELVDRPDVLFVVTFRDPDSNARAASFTLADLEGDTVWFDDEAMAEAELDASGDCEQGF